MTSLTEYKSLRRADAICKQFQSSYSTTSTQCNTGNCAATTTPTTATNEETLNSPIPTTLEATMYSSRQIPLFSAKFTSDKDKTVDTGLTVDQINIHRVPTLSDWVPNLRWYPNRFVRTKLGRIHESRSASAGQIATADPETHPEDVTYNQLIHDDEAVLMDIVRRPRLSKKATAFVRAGPRAQVCWARGEVVAAIVTCGGLCPGLNDVIAELFSTLYYNYGVDRVYGIRSGFRGFYEPQYQPWIQLTPNLVKGVYELGGTMLGSSRGGFDIDKILGACKRMGVNQLYIIGGDGTHRAAMALHEEARKRQLKMTVAGVPKTIDNDIGVIDRSFGFNTAVAEARKAIQSAVVEASCYPNGLGIVQLMGRHAGYISAHATLASRQVDLCLIPEVPFPLDGPYGVLTLIEEIIDRQGYSVIVVAEGAGEDLMNAVITETDPSGNKKLPEIGKFLQKAISAHFKSKGKEIGIKYHDPSYMIRSVPADAGDSVYCMTLAQNAVHGAMTGFTGFTSALVNNRTVLLPIPVITATSPSYLNPDGRTWERVVSLTHQPLWERSHKKEVTLAKDTKPTTKATADKKPAPKH